jgi:hypothetical protein
MGAQSRVDVCDEVLALSAMAGFTLHAFFQYNLPIRRIAMIELTPEQQRAIDAGNGSPPVLIDSRTQATYVLVPSKDFERPSATDEAAPGIPEISEGIRRAKAALRRDLPQLLASRWTRGKYALYHLEERVRVSSNYLKLIREANRRNLPDSTFIVERIKQGAGSVEETEIESFDV